MTWLDPKQRISIEEIMGNEVISKLIPGIKNPGEAFNTYLVINFREV